MGIFLLEPFVERAHIVTVGAMANSSMIASGVSSRFILSRVKVYEIKKLRLTIRRMAVRLTAVMAAIITTPMIIVGSSDADDNPSDSNGSVQRWLTTIITMVEMTKIEPLTTPTSR
jgi:hypothetical protein